MRIVVLDGYTVCPGDLTWDSLRALGEVTVYERTPREEVVPRIGDAQVSEKHAGFIVNLGSATASDILALMAEVQSRVLAASGITLEPEVRILGEDA